MSVSSLSQSFIRNACGKSESVESALLVWKKILPPLSNETITLVKDTSLVYVLALNDLLRATRNIVQRDFNVTPFLTAAAFYLIMTLILTWMFQYMEKRYAVYED